MGQRVGGLVGRWVGRSVARLRGCAVWVGVGRRVGCAVWVVRSAASLAHLLVRADHHLLVVELRKVGLHLKVLARAARARTVRTRTVAERCLHLGALHAHVHVHLKVHTHAFALLRLNHVDQALRGREGKGKERGVVHAAGGRWAVGVRVCVGLCV